MNDLKKALLEEELKNLKERKKRFLKRPIIYKSFIRECDKDIKKVERKLRRIK